MIATLASNAPAPWPLRAGVVHVWRFACDQDASAATLSPDEQRAAHRLVSPIHRDRYVVQHAMLRALLARYVAIAPAQIELVRAARGKPSVAQDDQLEFNLSHTDDVALLAVARGIAVGVDIERFDVGLDVETLARIVLAPDEADATDTHAFMRIWCRKEACLKATGVGLLDDLTAVSVRGDRLSVGGRELHVQDLAFDAAHAAALATTAAVAQVSSVERETYRD